MKITREQLRRWGACYNDAKIATLVPEAGLAPLEVAALNIPAEDRLWVLLHEEVIPGRDLRLLACDWAEAACREAGWNDERSLNAITVARRFACGEATEAELAEAAASAWAARAEAAASAWAARAEAAKATKAAAKAAWLAMERTWAAARAATSATAASAEASAWSTGVSVAWAEQLDHVVKVLKG